VADHVVPRSSPPQELLQHDNQLIKSHDNSGFFPPDQRPGEGIVSL